MKKFIQSLSDKAVAVLLALICVSFFYPFILKGHIPLPADTIVGMYHPWRDVVWDGFVAGVPFRNPLITDPVRQQYVWREQAVHQMKDGFTPAWNPYSFSGMPLAANMQSAAFYPFNLLFFFVNFSTAWGILIVLQPVLAAFFMYAYLRQLETTKTSSALGAITFAFSGFSIAWLEWNTVIHVVLWLPLILLAQEKLLTNATVRWSLVLLLAQCMAVLAGHLQILFYILVISNLYLIVRLVQTARYSVKVMAQKYILFISVGLLTAVVTYVQWWPTLQLILHSARDVDQAEWTKAGFFLPWQHLLQFLAPDFFGNPVTGNYWGVWNYGEFIGYIGILPLFFALYAIFFRRDRRTGFFALLAGLGLIFALPNPISALPFLWKIPFLSSSQPTRLIAVVDFSLAVLAALGLDRLQKKATLLQIWVTGAVLAVCMLTGWFIIIFPQMFGLLREGIEINIATKNLILPGVLLFLSLAGVWGLIQSKQTARSAVLAALMVLVVADLFRFGWKFTPFSPAQWIFPETKIIEYIQKEAGVFRVMARDRRIMPPNFSVAYKVADIAGYDPLYLRDYAHIVALWERDKPDISAASFNRILTPMNHRSFLTELMGVKYIVSMDEIDDPKLALILKEGQTYLYENKEVFPRAFLAESIATVTSREEEAKKIFELRSNLKHVATVSESILIDSLKLSPAESAEIEQYEPNYIRIKAKSRARRLLVLTDMYYPTWEVKVDGKAAKIFRVDLALRGVVIPEGEHTVEFTAHLL